MSWDYPDDAAPSSPPLRACDACPQCGAAVWCESGIIKRPDSQVAGDPRRGEKIRVIRGEEREGWFFACSACEWCHECEPPEGGQLALDY